MTMDKRKEHAEKIRDKVIPILELTRKNIADNSKVLSPMGGLLVVSASEEAERNRKARLDQRLEEMGMSQAKRQRLDNDDNKIIASPLKQINNAIVTHKEMLSDQAPEKLPPPRRTRSGRMPRALPIRKVKKRIHSLLYSNQPTKKMYCTANVKLVRICRVLKIEKSEQRLTC